MFHSGLHRLPGRPAPDCGRGDGGGRARGGHVPRACHIGGALRESALLTGPDGTLDSLPAPILEGSEFAGWFTAAGVPVEAGHVFAADETITARWTRRPEMVYDGETGVLTIRSGGGIAATCVIAWYAAEGRLLRTEVRTLTAEESSCTPDPAGAFCFKAFLLDGDSVPVSGVAYVYLG